MAQSQDRGGVAINSGSGRADEDPYADAPVTPRVVHSDDVNSDDTKPEKITAPQDFDDDAGDPGDETDSKPDTKPAEKKPAKPQDDEEDDDAAEDDIPADLYREAASKGVSRQTAERFASATALRHHLNEVDRMTYEFGKQLRGQNAPQNGQGQGQPQGQPQNSQGQNGQSRQTQEPPAPTPALAELFKKLDPEVVGLEVVDYLRHADAHYQRELSEVGALKTQIKEMQASFMEDFYERTMSDIDGYFSGLSPEWKDKFGEGETQFLDKNSDHFKNRLEIIKAMDDLQAGHKNRHGRKMPVKKAIETLHRIVFEKDFDKIASKRVVDQVRDRTTGQFTTRPNPNRRRAPQRGNEAGRAAVGSWLEKAGIADN